jgi:carbonic anhydrase
VLSGLARGDLHLYGWVYKIESGEVLSYHPESGRFVCIGERPPSPLPPPAGLPDLAAVH